VAVGKTAVSVADPDREQDSAKTGAITKFHDGLPFPRRIAPRRAARLVSTSSLPLPSIFSAAAAAPQTRFTRFSSRVRVHSSYTNACSIRMPVSFDDAVFSGARRDYGDIVEHSDAAARYSLVESELRFHAGIG